MRALSESAEDAYEKTMLLSQLHDEHVARREGLGRERRTALQRFSYLARNPVMKLKGTARSLGLSFNTMASSVNRLIDIGILVQSGGERRNGTFRYKEYLDILREGT